jgi:hypothetical protein
MFFAVDCPAHGTRVLLFAHDVTGMQTTPRGIEVRYRCFCGNEGVWLAPSWLPLGGGSQAGPGEGRADR